MNEDGKVYVSVANSTGKFYECTLKLFQEISDDVEIFCKSVEHDGYVIC